MPSDQQEQSRQQKFGHICRACSRCCPHKIIQVNPFEIAMLARFFGMSTGEIRDTYTVNDGAILKRTDDDACIFLGQWGCGVHPVRPLVCRLYPLGRRVTADGNETWVQTEVPADCEGEFTEDGTIAEYIAEEGALPYMQAADDYAGWVRNAYAMVESLGQEEVDLRLAGDLLDMDTTISAYCADHHLAEPRDIERRRLLHLKILYEYLDGAQHEHEDSAVLADRDTHGGGLGAGAVAGHGDTGGRHEPDKG